MEGVRLGPYQIARELGAGGMGKVYAATGPEGVVALKVVHPHLLETPGFFKRFLREAQLGQSIRHENVVRTLDCDQEFADGRPQCFLVMEYVEGQTLADLQRELEKVPEELCRHVAREICKGLAAVHEAGVVHRDLKPENVLITPEHVVKVMDLGVAQVADEALRLSKTGAFVGSVEYAAPEQFKGGDVDGRTDLHALGVLLYELSSGVHPYRGGGFHEVLTRVCDSTPRRLGTLNPQLSPFFEEVVHTLLVKDPRGRFASASQLLDVLVEGEDSAWWRDRALRLQAETRSPLRRVRIPRETAVYGREREIERLLELHGRAKAGEGQVVLIEGEAGIGKSRLVDEVIARLHASGEELHFLFGSYPPGGAATDSGAFSSAYREHLGEAGSAPYLTATPVLVPAFDALLRGESAPTGVEPLTRASLQACFVNATRALAAERTTVVLIDDLHFAPDEGRALFTSLAMGLPGHRVLLVGTSRPGLPEHWVAGLTRLEHTSQMTLPRLGPKDLAEMLADSFRSKELAVQLAGQIGIKSDGNPFFAFEIIRGLRDGQFITKKGDGTWASTRVIDEIAIPSSLLDLVNARVADLTEQERDLLDVASCCGFEFDPALVAEVVGEPLLPTLKRFAAIEKKHRLVRAAGRRLVFDHHQVQEALYSALYVQMREAYHAAIAEALESRASAAGRDPQTLDGALCVDLCEHFLAGARGEAAVRYLAAAQRHLERGHLGARVIALTDRMLAVPGLLTGATRAAALCRLATSGGPLVRLGPHQRVAECAREAVQLAGDAGDDALRRLALLALGNGLSMLARHDEAEATVRDALELARAAGDVGTEAAAISQLGSVLIATGRIAEAEEHYERALAIQRRLGDRAAEASCLGNLGRVFAYRGRHAAAVDLHLQALAHCREGGLRRTESVCLANLSGSYHHLGRDADARACAEQQLAISREIGDRESECVALVNLGGLLWSSGHVAEARIRLERCMALYEETGARVAAVQMSGNMGMILRALGLLDEAKAHFARCIAGSRETRALDPEARALTGLAAVASDEGDLARADALLVEALALARSAEGLYHRSYVQLELGVVRAQASGGADGRDLLAAARDDSAAADMREYEVAARCRLALLPGGDASDALAAYEEHAARLGADSARSTRLLLWRATGDRAHLAEAKRLLDEFLAKNPAEYHGTMCRNVALNRDILAAWRQEFGEGGEPRGAESVTTYGARLHSPAPALHSVPGSGAVPPGFVKRETGASPPVSSPPTRTR